MRPPLRDQIIFFVGVHFASRIFLRYTCLSRLISGCISCRSIFIWYYDSSEIQVSPTIDCLCQHAQILFAATIRSATVDGHCRHPYEIYFIMWVRWQGLRRSFDFAFPYSPLLASDQTEADSAQQHQVIRTFLSKRKVASAFSYSAAGSENGYISVSSEPLRPRSRRA